MACTLVPGGVNFSTAWDVAVGPDGRNVYLVTFSGSLFNFARDPATGALTYVNCVGNGTPCTDLIANAGAMSVAVSPDSQNVYVKTSIGLAVLDRDGGSLQVAQKPTFDGCFSEGNVPNCDEVDGLNGDSYGMEVSPDGRHVYVAFRSPGGVGIFNRAPDGKLSQPNGQAGGCVSANGNSAEALRCRDGHDYLSESFVVAVSPDGRSVYVGGRYGIFGYARDAATGYLTEIGCHGAGTGCARATPGLSYVFDLAVSPDGGEVVSAPYDSQAIVSFVRDPATGALTQRNGPRGCVANPAGGCQALALLSGNQIRLAMDPSGLRFYATSNSGMLATITRDYAPVCASSTVDAPFNTLDLGRALLLGRERRRDGRSRRARCR